MPRKKTTVIEKVQRRTPQGKLISEAVSKKVFFDGVPVDEIQPSFNIKNVPQPSPQEKFEEPEPLNRRHYELEFPPPRRHLESEALSRRRYLESEFSSRRHEDLRFLSRRGFEDPRFSSRRYYEDSRFPSRRGYEDSEAPTEIVEFRRIGDEARYFNNWDTALVKDAKLVRYDSCSSISSDYDSFDELGPLYSRINQMRMRNRVSCLKVDPLLTKKAKTWAMRISFEKNLRTNPDFASNVWIGKEITMNIVDEWNEEMKNWPRHFFECLSLRKMGIAKIQKNRDYVVVAFYD
ncbi:hypothetical protein FO519_008831 [Halicephalobus sp. NKZ332]|nr:hypothetical protein FO519_008831 [Halicephalobus sp. NKZ332]